MALGVREAVPSGAPAPRGPAAWGSGPHTQNSGQAPVPCVPTSLLPRVISLDLRGHLITLLHFTGGKTDMQSGKVTCPRPQRKSVRKTGLRPLNVQDHSRRKRQEGKNVRTHWLGARQQARRFQVLTAFDPHHYPLRHASLFIDKEWRPREEK